MRKIVVLCLCAYLIVAASFKVVSADEPATVTDQTKVEGYIANIYKQIDFSKNELLPYDVFAQAYRGFLNLKNAGKLTNDRDIITICNFSQPSTENRMWIIDLRSKRVLFNTYVAHGQGSGEVLASSFSNDFDSHQSSLGFYVTGETYTGEHGTSLRLYGMDQGFNDAAYDRGIVVHGADYVSDRFIRDNDKLGRSWGCPAVSSKLSLAIINAIEGGTCLFIYYPLSSYVKTAYWINKKISSLPDDGLFDDILPKIKKNTSYKIVEYVHRDGSIDSVKTVPLIQ